MIENGVVMPLGLSRGDGVYRIVCWMPDGERIKITITEEKPHPAVVAIALRELADLIDKALT